MSGELDALNPTDTHGIPITSHALSLDSGILSKFFGGGLADLQFSAMKLFGFVGCAVLNIVSSFNWLSPVVDLLETVSDAVTGTLGAAGLGAIALAIATMIFGVHWLRGTSHRIAYHLGMALVLMLIGVFMVSPVRFAAQMVTGGGAIATEIGQQANHTSRSSSISQILATKYVREPLFRANYGVNLDEIGSLTGSGTCGDVYDSAIRDNIPADEIKDRIANNCVGGDKLARYAKNPFNLNFELMLGCSVLLVLFIFIVIVCIRMVTAGVAAVLHGSAVKPSLLFVMAGPVAQVYTLRNMIALPLCALAVAGDLLLLVLSASFTALIAVAAGSGAIASLITCLSMIGLILGTWRFSRNLRGSGRQTAEQLARSRSPELGAMRAQEARQAVKRVVTQGATLAATLSGNPAAGTAMSALGPGVIGGGPRSMSALHERGAFLNGGAGHSPVSAGDQVSAVAAASQVAEQLSYRPLTALPTPQASPVQIPSFIPNNQPAPMPVPRQVLSPVAKQQLLAQRETTPIDQLPPHLQADQPKPQIPTLGQTPSSAPTQTGSSSSSGARPRPGLSTGDLNRLSQQDSGAADQAARAADEIDPYRGQTP